MSKGVSFSQNRLVPITIRDGNLKDAIVFFKIVSRTNVYTLCRESLTNGMKLMEEHFLLPWSYCSEKDIFITHYEKRTPSFPVSGRPFFCVVEEVNKIFESQLDITFYYLKIKSEENTQTKSKKEYFRQITVYLEECCSSVMSNTEYKNYQSDTIRPYLLILTEIHEKYQTFAPPISNYINDLFLEYPQFKSKHVKRNLKIEIIEELLKLNDQYSDDIFRICFNPPKEDTLRKSLRNFIYGQFEKITTPIEFFWKSEPTYYLIFKLCQYIGYTECQVATFPNTLFIICGSPYSISSAYSAKRRIANRKHDFKNIIDSFIESNLH